MKKIASLPLFLALLALPALAQDEQPKRSVIFFIGDGMGADQITLGRLGAKELGQAYAFDRFKTIGLSSTHSADMLVTDSAAGATAMACGEKTNNKVVGMGPTGKSLQTILEAANACGYMTGLASTTRITHATPACFATHVNHRKDEGEIAKQLAARGFPEVMIGGGARYFPAELISQLEGHGYAVVKDPAALADAKPTVKDGRPRLAGLITKSHLPYKIDGGPRASVRAMTEKAVEVLSSTDRPFFLMVEGGRIDHGGHAHDAVSTMHEQLELASAIDWALDRAAKDPNLLIVVTADHATGNLGISEQANIKGILAAKASSEGLSKGFGDLSTAEGKAGLADAVLNSHGFKLTDAELARVSAKAGSKYFASTVLGHLMSERFGIYHFQPELQEEKMIHTHGHDGSHVPVFAFGPQAELFAGTYENNEIPRKIAAILGLESGIEPGSALAPKSASKSGAKK